MLGNACCMFRARTVPLHVLGRHERWGRAAPFVADASAEFGTGQLAAGPVNVATAGVPDGH